MTRLHRFPVWALIALAVFFGACRQSEEITTQTSEVVVLDDEPATSLDPFDEEFMVDGERALRIVPGVAPPRLVSRGPRVRYPSSDRRLCFPGATIIVVVDKTGAVRETKIVDVQQVIEYTDEGRKTLSEEESRALLEEREFAIRNWQYEPAMKDGEPVPSIVDGGWRMRCR